MKVLLDFLKLPAHILGALALASGGVLFLPKEVIEKLYLLEVKDRYGLIIGVAFLLSSSLLTISFVRKNWELVVEQINFRRVKREQIKYLSELDSLKTNLIIKFLQMPTHTLLLPFDDGVTAELNGYGIISLTSSIQTLSHEGYEVNYFLQPWVRKLIKEEKQLQKKFGFEHKGRT